MAKQPRFGASEPLHIFQDDFFDTQAPMISHAPMPSTAKPMRRPLGNTTGNVVLNPPNMSAIKQSPYKSAMPSSTSPLSPLRAFQENRLGAVSIKPPSDQLRSTDSIPKKQPLMSRFKTVAQKPPMDPSLAYAGKENAHPMLYPAPPTLNLSIENYYQKPSGKRLLEPAPIKDNRPQKKARLEDGPLPPHDSFPPIVDDGTKPGHSYAMLIGMAILRSPHRRLTLSQIYKWISDNYSFYSPQDAGWQNSIRHNLSLNKAFIKQERPKDDPGKGNYWAIEQGMEHQFMKEKPSRKSIATAENLPVMSTMMEPSMPPASLPEPTLPPQLPLMPEALSAVAAFHIPAPPVQPEPSSDATIAVSDAAAPEETLEKSVETDAPLDCGLYSPLPAAMHSSPPIPRILETRSGTPPPAPRINGSSASRSHKRKFASMDDSGYISSLESSVLRSNQNGRLLTSEADRPRVKRGRGGASFRAEDEIARIRASSYESPTKGRARNGGVPPSSSPLRQGAHGDAAQMLPPLTPAVKLKAPPKPPPSASPNTNLRIHRNNVQNMLASPLRRISSISDDKKFWGSPLVKKSKDHPLACDDLAAYSFDLHNPSVGWEIFQEDSDHLSSFFPLGNATEVVSPEPPTAKRLRLDRSQSAGALSDVTNTGPRRSANSKPLLRVGQSPSLALDTPSKLFDGLPSSPSKLFAAVPSPSKLPALDEENTWFSMDDFCTTDLLQEVDDFGGLDILQGFEKIGSAAAVPPSRLQKAGSKPALGRSYTSTF